MCVSACTLTFVSINTKRYPSYSDSHGAERETVYLYRISEMKWPAAFLSVFGSHIQGPSVHTQLGSPGGEKEGKGNDNNIELRLQLILYNLQQREESSPDFISVTVTHLLQW